MSQAPVFILAVAAVGVAALARRRSMPTPLVLVVAGLIASFIPGTPAIELNPDLVLFVILPPMLFSSALDSSYLGLRANLRAVALLSVGLVVFTSAAVAAVVMLIDPSLGWGLAIVLGAVVAPPDAVAASAIGRTLALPRRVLTILGGESMLNDATALTIYRVALAAVLGGTVSLWGGFGTFALAVVAGVGVGLILGTAAVWLLCHLADASVEVAVFLLVPFGAYALAEQIHGSGVLAVVIGGLVIGRKMPKMRYATRLQGGSVIKTIDFVLETLVFGLIGLQLRSVISSLSGHPAGVTVMLVVGVTLVVLVARIVWCFPATYIPRRLSRRIREREISPPLANIAVISWSGMRGVVTLAAAYALPLRYDDGRLLEGRDLVLLCSFAVVVATLLIQGLSLPWLIRRLKVSDSQDRVDALAEAEAAQAAATVAIERLEELTVGSSPSEQPVIDELRSSAESRANSAWERLGPQGPERLETPSELYRRLRRDMLRSERSVYIAQRDAGKIDDEVLRRVQLELDLEEAQLDR